MEVCNFAGMEQIIDYVTNLHFSKEDIEYLRMQNLFSKEFLEYLENFRFKGNIYSFDERNNHVSRRACDYCGSASD